MTALAQTCSIRDFFKSFVLLDLVRGLLLTGRKAFARKVTLQYPEEKTPRSPRFRGLPALRRDADSGEERCIGCRLCETACPAAAITIELGAREDGSQQVARYDLDLNRCMFCGFCEESCPVDAIALTQAFEYYGEKRIDLHFTKEKLLALGERHENEIAAAREKDAQYR